MNESSIAPPYEQFVKRSEQARLVPVAGRFISDLDTPLTLFSKIYRDREHVFLFESMEGGEKWGRYSFIGFDPLLIFVSHESSLTVTRMFRGSTGDRAPYRKPCFIPAKTCQGYERL